MKNVGILVLLSIIALGVGLVGCKKERKGSDLNESITWQRLSAFAEYTDPFVAENWPKGDEAGIPNCWVHVDVLYPEIDDNRYVALRDSLVKSLSQRISMIPNNNFSKDSIQAFVDSFVSAQISDYKEDLSQASELDFDVFSYSVFSRRIDLCDSLVYNKNGIVSITMLSQEYTGGAHGNDLLTTFCYDLDQNEIITPSVLFSDPKDSRIVEILLGKLMAEFDVNTPEELEYAGIFNYQALDITNNFYFTEDGVTFYYNPYELAAYAVGPIELSVSYSELSPFINGAFTKLLP